MLGTLVRRLSQAVMVVTIAVGVGLAQEGGDKAYPDGVDGLKQLWTDVLAKATAGDEAAVKGMLEKMVLSDADFGAIMPEDKAKDLGAKYAEKFAKKWPDEAKNLVAKVKERAYDEVEVTEVIADKASKNDKKVLGALKDGTKMYSVRVKKKGEKSGLRYDCFFFVNGAWKTGLKLGSLFPKDAKEPAPKPGEKPAKPEGDHPDEGH